MLNSRITIKRALNFTLTKEEQELLSSISYEELLESNDQVIHSSGDGDELETLVHELVLEEQKEYFNSEKASFKTEEEKMEHAFQIESMGNRFLINMGTGKSSKHDLLGPSIHEEYGKTTKNR